MFSSLEGQLDKPASRIRQHWIRSIEHVLTRHQDGMLDEDFKAKILHYMVHNSHMYLQDVKWDEVALLPDFLGSTGTYLRLQAEELSTGAREMLKKQKKPLFRN